MKNKVLVSIAIIMALVLSAICMTSCDRLGVRNTITGTDDDEPDNSDEYDEDVKLPPQIITFHDISFTVPGEYDLDNSISDDETIYYKVFDENGDPEKMIYALYQEGNRDDNILDDKNASAYCNAITSESNIQGYNGYEVINIDEKLSALYYTFQLDSDGKTYNNAAVVFNNDEGHIYSIYASSLDDDYEELLHSIIESLNYNFEIWQRRYIFKLEIYFEENLFLDKYDVEVYLDDEKLGTVKQGKTFNYEAKVKEGNYRVAFYKGGNHEVSGSADVHVAENKAFYCTIKSHSEDIEIKNQEEEILDIDDPSSEQPDDVGSGKHDLILTVEYNSNIFFNKYNVDIYINSTKVGSVSQGKSFKETINYKEGEQNLIFRSSEDRSVKGATPVNIDCDRYYSCSITAESDAIEISNKKTETVAEVDRKKALKEAQKRAEEARKAAKEKEEAEEKERRSQFETAIKDSVRSKIATGEQTAEQYGYEVRLFNLDNKNITKKYNKKDKEKRKTYRIYKVDKVNHDEKYVNLIVGTVKTLSKDEKKRFSNLKKEPLKYAYDQAKEDGYTLVVKNRKGKRVDNKKKFKKGKYVFMSVEKVNYDKSRIVVKADTKKHIAELKARAKKKAREKAAKLKRDAKRYAANARDHLTVWVTRTGTYHLDGCGDLNKAKSYIAVYYGTAKKRYHACMHCNPDTYCERCYDSFKEEYMQNHK